MVRLFQSDAIFLKRSDGQAQAPPVSALAWTDVLYATEAMQPKTVVLGVGFVVLFFVVY